MFSYIPLKNHTAYSLCEGAVKISDYVKAAEVMNFPALGICDTGNLFGALEFANALSNKGIQPIIGAMFFIMDVGPYETFQDSVTLFAQSEQGYLNLMKLSSLSYIEGYVDGVPNITTDWLERYSGGLIFLSSGNSGALNRLLKTQKKDQAFEFAKKWSSVFSDRFYIEIARHSDEDTALEEKLLILALELNIPIVAVNETFFKTREDHEAHDALVCIREGIQLDDENRLRLTEEHYLKSHAEMAELFSDLPEALENSILIAKRCAYWPTPQKPMLPKFPLEGITEEDELKRQAIDGLNARLEHQVYPLCRDENEKQEVYQKYKDRLDYELSIINQMGFPGYFLIVSDFIKWAKNQNIPVGPGRGSGAGSCVAWSLLITDVDPIRFDLIFERFLNPERVSMPDFDVDFCQERRDEVIEYVCKKYGADRVAQIITFGKFQARAIVKDVGRVLGMPYSQVDRLSKLIPHNPANPLSLKEAIAQEPLFRTAIDEDEDCKVLMDYALKLEGLYRHASTHAAGVVIGDRPLTEVVPLYHDQKSALPAVQFSMKYAELAGLMKFDFLGLKTLTIIADAIHLIKKTKDQIVDITTINLDDKLTFELLNRLETIGIFQIESPGMKEVVRKMKPDRFEDIIALVALYRPGPMDDIPRYCACKHGEEEIYIPHPMIDSILRPTYGVMVYQEQVMQIAQVMCGYTLGGADLLRRAMGKKIKEEMDAQRARFVEGAVQNNVDAPLADRVFDAVAKFAGYGFNKSHAAPYALISYQTAYLKANFPVEFMSSTMTHDRHNTDKLAVYNSELKRMKIKLLPPDINSSFDVFAPEGDAIRYALSALKGLGVGAVQHIAKERAKGPFKSITDFAKRIESKFFNKKLLESLIFGGAFDNLHDNRAELAENVESLLTFNSEIHKEKTSNQMSLFDQDQMVAPPKMKSAPYWNEKEKAEKEFKVLGFYLTLHPLDPYRKLLERRSIVSSYELSFLKTAGVVQMVGVVHSVQVKTSKTGKKFAFVHLSDYHGTFEITVFSEVLEKSREHLEPGKTVIVKTQIRVETKEDSDEETIRLTTESIEPFHKFLVDHNNYLQVKLNPESDINQVCKIFQETGGVKVYLKFLVPSKESNQMIAVTPPMGCEISPETLMDVEKIPGVQVQWL